MCRLAGISGAVLNIIEAGPELDDNEEPQQPNGSCSEVHVVIITLPCRLFLCGKRLYACSHVFSMIHSTDLLRPVQTDLRFRCELTSLMWLLSLATAGNLLAITSEQTPKYARNLVQVHVCLPTACL
jgi:hypothetical protein